MAQSTLVAEPAINNLLFSDLALPVGASLTLETLSPLRKLPVKLLGYDESRSIMVSAPLRQGKEVYLEKGSRVVVRLMDGRHVCAFESHVQYRCVQPYSYYHLSYPFEIESTQVRNAERVAISLDTWVDSDFVLVGDWPKSACISNLSRSGARLEADEFLGQPGHELILDFNLPVSGLNKRIHVAAVIRSTERQSQDRDAEAHVMGVQFRDMSDETRLALANFIHEFHHTKY